MTSQRRRAVTARVDHDALAASASTGDDPAPHGRLHTGDYLEAIGVPSIPP